MHLEKKWGHLKKGSFTFSVHFLQGSHFSPANALFSQCKYMAAHAILLTPRHSNSCKNSTREKRHKWQISIFWKITSTNIRFFKNLKLFGVAFFCCALIGTYLVMGLSWHTLSYRFRYLLERLQSLRRGDINWHWKWTKITVPLFCQFYDITTWNIDKSFCQLGIRSTFTIIIIDTFRPIQHIKLLVIWGKTNLH